MMRNDASRPTAARLAASALAACLLLATPAQADLYRCAGADGNIVFTDRPSQCPGAARHEPAGDLQTVETPGQTSPRRAGPPASRAAAGHSKQEMALWQQKKAAAERELARAEERREELQRYVAACNRGWSITGRDDTGLKYTIPCQRIRDEYATIEEKLPPLRDYLENGLGTECRQAGCLPGWIR